MTAQPEARTPTASTRLLRGLAWLLAAGAALLLVLAALGWLAMRGSLPQLDGRIELPGLAGPLSIGRDSLGTVVLRGAKRLDLARGLGYVHAQERYFEMDLTRRSAAGELSALFGPLALERDRARRPHRLRARLAERLAQLPAAERELIDAYVSGVNAGLAALAVRPWPYLLLRAEPRPWDAVDSMLVAAEMYFTLQSQGFDTGFQQGLLRERAGDTLFFWLHPQGGRWDAALDGSMVPPTPLPGAEVLDLRQAVAPPRKVSMHGAEAAPVPGSNNWAVAGSRTADGGAILANDMHLSLTVPNIWFRAQFEFDHADAADAASAGSAALPQRAAGLTLPGLPVLVAGSNGAVAWGYTNATGQWFDWVRLPASVPPGRLRSIEERIEVKGQAAVALRVDEFDGNPVIREHEGRRYALRWVAHRGEAYNLALDRMLGARDAAAATAVAQRAGMPQQNILIADRNGAIRWTIAGRLWAQGSREDSLARFHEAGLPQRAWLAPEAYPLVADPANGQLSTANARQLGGAAADVIGDGGLDLGARGQQIRDRLAERAHHDETSLAAIHLDNEARFMRSWAQRAQRLVAASPAHAEVAALLQAWNGRADAEQPAYRLVRAWRLRVLDTLWLAWTTPALGTLQADEKTRVRWRPAFEDAATQALDAQPPHLLPPGHASFDALGLAMMDATVKDLTLDGQRPLAAATWGQENTSRIQHPLSRALPPLARLLDMPALPQGGDSHLPHVARPVNGQSQRMVVAPGHEERATLVMPGGQSGHPLSPFCGAGHAAWAAGQVAPLLAGPALHRLEATPGR